MAGGHVLYLRSNDGAARLSGPLFVGAIAGLVIVLTALVWRARRPDTATAEKGGPNHSAATDEPRPFSAPARVALVGLLWTAFGLLGVASFAYQPNRYVVPVLPGLALIAGAGVAVVVHAHGPPPVLRMSGLAVVLVL